MKTAEDLLNEKGGQVISVAPDSTVYDALSVMCDNNIGSILVKDGENMVGIWTERDLIKLTLEKNFNPKTAKISECMSVNLVKAPHDCSIYKMMDVFLGKRLRHLLIEKEGVFIGLLSIGDVVKANLVEKTQELENLNKIVSFEYYSNWQWKKKK